MKHIVIPARFSSSRLPGKPLLKIHNREIWVVPVEAVLSQACYDLLDEQLTALGIDIP